MGEWQRNELAEEKEVVYLIAMHHNNDHQDPTPANLDRWKNSLNFDATVMLLDYNQVMYEKYAQANKNKGNFSQAVTVIIDKKMKIRRVGATYDTNHKLNLEAIQELVKE